jgi:hypothetical protein
MNPNVQDNATDQYYALIIGENADDAGASSSVLIENNSFTHEELIQNTKDSRGLRSLHHNGHHHRRVGEWQINLNGLSEADMRNIGGCPFGRR